ncbi:MAG: hypothetical protein EOP49_31935, partial [Sphingobacteriales bacterium]
MNPKTDFYFNKDSQWTSCVGQLREIILGCELTEELKWGVPCYTYENRNIVLIHVFKAYCAVLFFKGSLLDDPSGLLIQQTENVQAARQMRFTSLEEVIRKKAALKSFIKEAIDAELSGFKPAMRKTAEYAVTEEFKIRLDKDAALKEAFEALTPGRQRAYLLHFASPKQSKTRETRIDKATAAILQG